MDQRGADWSRWITAGRGPRNAVDAGTPYAFLLEREPVSPPLQGGPRPPALADVWTVFLTNRECPWRCLMCDLWKNTLQHPVAPGAIPRQIDHALERLEASRAPGAEGSVRWLKLYNSGSFFDPGAIPTADHGAIAQRAGEFHRLIVECHPSLIGDRVSRFRDRLRPSGTRAREVELEVAMGLETVHPFALERLNKRMTVDSFARAASFLRREGIALRVFLLVHPPFVPPDEARAWLDRSVLAAFEFGASTVSLIPTRLGSGALDRVADAGLFSEPRLADLEDAFDQALGLGRGKVLADLWDLDRFSRCRHCLPARRARLERMNLVQTVLPRVACQPCAAAV